MLMYNNLYTNTHQTDTAYTMKDALSGSKRAPFIHQKDDLQTKKQWVSGCF